MNGPVVQHMRVMCQMASAMGLAQCVLLAAMWCTQGNGRTAKGMVKAKWCMIRLRSAFMKVATLLSSCIKCHVVCSA